MYMATRLDPNKWLSKQCALFSYPSSGNSIAYNYLRRCEDHFFFFISVWTQKLTFQQRSRWSSLSLADTFLPTPTSHRSLLGENFNRLLKPGMDTKRRHIILSGDIKEQLIIMDRQSYTWFSQNVLAAENSQSVVEINTNWWGGTAPSLNEWQLLDLDCFLEKHVKTWLPLTVCNTGPGCV